MYSSHLSRLIMATKVMFGFKNTKNVLCVWWNWGKSKRNWLKSFKSELKKPLILQHQHLRQVKMYFIIFISLFSLSTQLYAAFHWFCKNSSFKQKISNRNCQKKKVYCNMSDEFFLNVDHWKTFSPVRSVMTCLQNYWE